MRENSYEDISGHEEIHYVKESFQDDNGDVRYRFVPRVRLSNVPFTPQSGLECRQHDLGFIFTANLKLEHQPAYLSVARSGNPLAESLFVQQYAKMVEKEFDKISNNKKN